MPIMPMSWPGRRGAGVMPAPIGSLTRQATTFAQAEADGPAGRGAGPGVWDGPSSPRTDLVS